MSGLDFEKYLQAHFRNQGYRVELTAATADYGVDLICSKDNVRKAVQAKRYKDKVGIKAVQEVIGGMKYYNCSEGLVITNSYFTKNAEELAKRSNVTLWDRNVLIKNFHVKT